MGRQFRALWTDQADRGGGQRPGQARGSHRCVPAVRSGFLHLAEALAFRGDMEVVSSTVRALVATLKAGEKCGVEPELIGKGMWAWEDPWRPCCPYRGPHPTQ